MKHKESTMQHIINKWFELMSKLNKTNKKLYNQAMDLSLKYKIQTNEFHRWHVDFFSQPMDLVP